MINKKTKVTITSTLATLALLGTMGSYSSAAGTSTSQSSSNPTTGQVENGEASASVQTAFTLTHKIYFSLIQFDSPIISEEAGNALTPDETFDAVRSGARLILAYDAQSNSFVGTVENTTNSTLSQVRVEVHLSNGTELGPTTPVDLASGEQVDVVLSAEDETFDGWTPHAEVNTGDGGEHGGEGGGDGGGDGGNEEAGNALTPDETFDAVRSGARLILAYDAQSNSFVGTVENITTNTLNQVRVEVHLSNGTELGPTTPVDLVPGEQIPVTAGSNSRTVYRMDPSYRSWQR